MNKLQWQWDPVNEVPVKWLYIGDFKYPQKEGLQTTVHGLKNHENILEFERRIIKSPQNETVKKTNVI